MQGEAASAEYESQRDAERQREQAVPDASRALPRPAVAARLRSLPRAYVHVLLIAWWWELSRALVLCLAAYLPRLSHVPLLPSSYLPKHALGVSGPLSVLGAWDGHWYRLIAERGYLLLPGRQSDPAFFPLFPAILSWLHDLGLSYFAAAVLFSNLCLLLGLVAFYFLSRELFSARRAYRATVLVTLFPAGFVFSMAYPEALVFALMALCALAAYRRAWLLAAPLAALGALARPEALFLFLPLLALAIRQWPRLSLMRRAFAVTSVLAAPLALISYPLYLGHALGDVSAWSKAQAAWGRSFSWHGPVRAVHELESALGYDRWLWRDAVFLGLYLVLLLVALLSRVPWGWLVAGLLVLLLPVMSGSFESLMRFGLLVFPVYWGLSALARRWWLDWPLRLASLAGLAWLTLTIPLRAP